MPSPMDDNGDYQESGQESNPDEKEYLSDEVLNFSPILSSIGKTFQK